ncbi:hypothetical protein DPEC_G00101770 [Dallia pectoralis]|uniref:Uncharacterized protein n=1 Tax=Dallia pectoralis TaxID=75939 RepID=A0ACC2GWN0_DALPE|nr:hypothetical protein DPEC_G00101770 [Dallia pectoralis]
MRDSQELSIAARSIRSGSCESSHSQRPITDRSTISATRAVPFLSPRRQHRTLIKSAEKPPIHVPPGVQLVLLSCFRHTIVIIMSSIPAIVIDIGRGMTVLSAPLDNS